jgi:hypothetical protein
VDPAGRCPACGGAHAAQAVRPEATAIPELVAWGTGLPAAIPRVTPGWWQALCREWVDPRLRDYAAWHPQKTTTRAQAIISRAGGSPAASAVLAELTPTLLHGDVHPGNLVKDRDRATLID